MSTRRDFLAGKGFLETERESPHTDMPLTELGDTIRLSTPAMASDFEVILNPGAGSRLEAASAALEIVNQLEDQLSVYRPHSELSLLNARGAVEPVPVERRLFELLQRAVQFSS